MRPNPPRSLPSPGLTAGALALALALLVAPRVAAALDRFVAPAGSDSADGSAARPWRTLQHAADAARPGVTIHVRPGRYPSGTIRSRVDGTARARIRFVADSTWGAHVVVGPSRLHYAWWQAGAFTDIVGFDVTGDGWTGIAIEGDNVRVSGNRVHDFPGAGSRGAAGILVEDAARAVIEGNLVHGIGRPDSSNGLVHGIYLSRGARGAAVRNNIVWGNQDAGICAWHSARDATIANNTVFANGNWGIQVGGAEGSVADHFVVVNNIVFDNGGYGLAEIGLSGTHDRFANNLVHGNRAAFDVRTSAPPSGTIDADPRFVRYARDGSGDYRLRRDSPCVDAGTQAGAPADDYDGRARPRGRGIDVGAFESW